METLFAKFRMWEQLKRRSSYQALPTYEPKKDIYRDLHHPVFQNIRVVQVIISPLNWATKNVNFKFTFTDG
jgi:hypothetical protein